MTIHLAAICDGDIDPCALRFFGFDEIPVVEAVPAFQNHDLGPFGCEIGVPLCRNGFVLHFPEGFAVREIPVLSEQVVGDGAGVGGKIEQSMGGADGIASEQPVPQV